MSWKVLGMIIIAALLGLGLVIWATYLISYKSGAAAAQAQCDVKLTTQQQAYQQAQQLATAKAAAAQAAADQQRIADLSQQLKLSSAQAQEAQKKAQDAAAVADHLNATLARLKRESKDVDTWSGACLPIELLASLHPKQGSQATAGACR